MGPAHFRGGAPPLSPLPTEFPQAPSRTRRDHAPKASQEAPPPQIPWRPESLLARPRRRNTSPATRNHVGGRQKRGIDSGGTPALDRRGTTTYGKRDIMSRIELFAERDFLGNSMTLDADTPNLTLKGFNDVTKSMRVIGEPWVVFQHINYEGEFNLYRPGNYNSLGGFEDMISSVRKVSGGLDNPEIILYEHTNYGGRSVTLTNNAEDLRTYGFNDTTSSHKMIRGAGVLYEHIHFQGKKMVTLPGDNVPDYVPLGWNDAASVPCMDYEYKYIYIYKYLYQITTDTNKLWNSWP
uniref:Beta/gamma crystallin 'Greek key' domain-containing protein n=1 Tax=Leptobrachium leishanense TaxID=445787 RepID=A0A8C5PFS4_9ANUR